MNTLKQILIYATLIAIVGLGINYIFGIQNATITYLSQETNPTSGIVMYKYDFAAYFRNLQIIFEETPNLYFDTPTRTWQPLNATNFGEALGNNLALLLDYIIYGLNILIFPIRVGGYIARIVLSIVGVNMITPPQTGITWLIELINALKESQIPYV